jgi:hypothetical protein
MADNLLTVMMRMVDITEVVLAAQQEARAAGQAERSISLDLVLHCQRDAMLAMAELLVSEGTLPPLPPRGGPKGGRRLRTVA